jgi:hypothetical protein
MQSLSVVERDQIIFHPMDQKGWASNVFDLCKIVKSILNKIFQNLSSLVLSNRPYRFKTAHEQECTGLPHTGHMSCRPTSHAPAENDYVFLLDAKHLV